MAVDPSGILPLIQRFLDNGRLHAGPCTSQPTPSSHSGSRRREEATRYSQFSILTGFGSSSGRPDRFSGISSARAEFPGLEFYRLASIAHLSTFCSFSDSLFSFC